MSWLDDLIEDEMDAIDVCDAEVFCDCCGLAIEDDKVILTDVVIDDEFFEVAEVHRQCADEIGVDD